MRKVDLIETLIVIVCSIFIVTLSLYHMSFNGYLGLSEKTWGLIWSLSENGLMLTLSFILIYDIYKQRLNDTLSSVLNDLLRCN